MEPDTFASAPIANPPQPPKDLLQSQIPHTSRIIEDVTVDKVYPTSALPNRQQRPMIFDVAPVEGKLVDLSNIVLHTTQRVVSGESGQEYNMANEFEFSVITGSSIFNQFSDIKIEANQVPIYWSAGHNQQFCHMFYMFRQSKSKELLVNECNPFYPDRTHATLEGDPPVNAPPEAEAGTDTEKTIKRLKRAAGDKKYSIGELENVKIRSKAINKSRPLDLAGYIPSNFTLGKHPVYIPDNVTIRFHFTPASPCSTFLSQMENPDLRMEITEAFLSVPRIKPKQYKSRDVIVALPQTKIDTWIIPQSSNTFRVNVCRDEKLPDRLIMWISPETGIFGDWRTAQFRGDNCSLLSWQIINSGMPSTPIEVNFSPSPKLRKITNGYFNFLENMKVGTHSIIPKISKKRYYTDAFYIAADLTNDHMAGSGWKNPSSTGTLDVELRFNTAPGKNMCLYVFKETLGQFKMSKHGIASITP